MRSYRKIIEKSRRKKVGAPVRDPVGGIPGTPYSFLIPLVL
jgi:hypothetical protein